MFPADQAAVMADIMEVDDFLSTQKGYGFSGIGRKQRIMNAGLIVTSDYIGQSDAMHTAAIREILNRYNHFISILHGLHLKLIIECYFKTGLYKKVSNREE